MDQNAIQYLIQKGHEWILSQRDLHVVTAKAISEQDRKSLKPYFEPELLSSARIKLVDSIENPPFYSDLNRMGISNLVNFSQMDGITFVDCILISKRRMHTPQSWSSLLFHEMVHVVQYHLLGTQKFAELYVLGWAQNDFDYGRIPLEVQAYNLQELFNQGGNPFSVLQILRK